ncbi:MAG: single-stranded DNA-binding protein [Patescibacteria group bacterium]|mgnify:FL=1
MNLNKVLLIGRLTQDPETRATPGGQTVTTIRMATNRNWTNQTSGQKQESTEFHTVVAWGRLAEIASQYLKRGGLVLIEGRLQTRTWVGKDTVKRYTTEIVAENLQLGPRSYSQGGSTMSDVRQPDRLSGQGSEPATKPASQPNAAPLEDEIPIISEDEVARQGQEIEEEEVKIKEEDLPF